jgi:hypothetical protein
MTALPPNFRLDLTALQKRTTPAGDNPAPAGAAASKPGTVPPVIQQALQKGATVQARPRPAVVEGARQGTTLARKNLVIQSSDSESDLDLELEQIPVGTEDSEAKADVPDIIEAPVIQVSQLPELEDEDDEFHSHGESKLSLLQDLLLTPDLADEPPDEWTYRKFIKQFAKSEASQEDGEDDGEGEGEDEADDYYDFDGEEDMEEDYDG